MRKIDKLLNEYGESHKNPTNKLIHWICVPAIFFSVVGLIWSIPNDILLKIYDHPFATWATVALMLVIVYYLSLSFTLATGITVYSLLCLYLARIIDNWQFTPLWLVCVAIFVVAWIGQFYGHKVEGKKPSFFKDVQFLMIGPAWLMHFIFKKIGIPY